MKNAIAQFCLKHGVNYKYTNLNTPGVLMIARRNLLAPLFIAYSITFFLSAFVEGFVSRCSTVRRDSMLNSTESDLGIFSPVLLQRHTRACSTTCDKGLAE